MCIRDSSTSFSHCGNRRRSRNRCSNFILRQLGLQQPESVHNNEPWRGISVHTDIPRTRYDQPDDHTKSYHRNVSDRHNFNVYAIGRYGRKISRTAAAFVISGTTFLSGGAAWAESVGGVSATANPIANSSGSVTNQAIQVLQGPYVTNTYGLSLIHI